MIHSTVQKPQTPPPNLAVPPGVPRLNQLFVPGQFDTASAAKKSSSADAGGMAALANYPKSARKSARRGDFTQRNMSMLQTLSADQVKEYRELFTLFDLDHDECINAKELGTAIRSFGMETSDEEIAAMVAEVDVDGSGAIDFQEFLILMTRSTNEAELEEELRQCFAAFDKNNTGFISVEDFRAGITQFTGEKLDEEEVDAFFLENGAGESLSFEKFVELLCTYNDPKTMPRRNTRTGSINPPPAATSQTLAVPKPGPKPSSGSPTPSVTDPNAVIMLAPNATQTRSQQDSRRLSVHSVG